MLPWAHHSLNERGSLRLCIVQVVLIYGISSASGSPSPAAEPASAGPTADEAELLAELGALRSSVDDLAAATQASSAASPPPASPRELPAGHDRLCRWANPRLPTDVRPTHYDWTLEPEVGAGAAGFEGVIQATVRTQAQKLVQMAAHSGP